jgi:hypothetical protein
MHGYKEDTRMKRTSRILTLILALVMIMSALVCISVFAEEEEVKPSIGAANVVYGEEIRIAFTIKDAGEGEYGIAVVEGEEIVYASFNEKTDGAVAYYLTDGIAAKDINTVYTYAVVEKTDDGIEIVSDLFEYSVAKYAAERIATEGITDAQKNLYNKLIAYGNAAQAVLTPAAE